MPTDKITVSVSVPVPAQRAWDIYTQPDHITQWNFASDDWCCPSATADLREGGAYSARMEARDGSFGFDLEATYTRVETPKHLEMVMTDGRRVQVAFDAENGSTKVTTQFDPDPEHPHDFQREGWQAIADNFAKHCATVG